VTRADARLAGTWAARTGAGNAAVAAIGGAAGTGAGAGGGGWSAARPFRVGGGGAAT